MIHDIFMPRLSSTMQEGKITEWLKSPGDKVKKGETLLVVESDKADMDVEAFNEGYLAAIVIEAGQEAPVDSTIAFIAETEAEIEAAKQQAAALKDGSSAPASAPAKTETEVSATTAAATTTTTTTAPRLATGNGSSQTGNGRIIVSPRAKKLAKQLGVDLKSLQGSGPYGRIVAADIEQAAGKTPAAPQATPTVSVAPPTPAAKPPTIAPAATNITPGEIVPLNTLQKAVVQNMMASLQIPTFHVTYSITTDALDKLYQQIKSKGVTMTALLAKAIASTLQNHPVVNASYNEGSIHYNAEINVAIAVAMPDGGLITPVLRNADQMDIYSLSRTWKDLVNRARAKQLQPEEYNTGTFTLSNLGMFGVDNFDAILPPGQGSILAVGGALPQVVANEAGMIGVQRHMKVNMTSDHRIIYGAQAAAFLKDLAELIATNPQSLTL